MEKVNGICMVLGPNGLLPNPLKKEEVVAEAQNKRYANPPTTNYVFASYDLALETAKAASKRSPECHFHVLQTATVLISEIKEPETLAFNRPE